VYGRFGSFEFIDDQAHQQAAVDRIV
jgi:hypothetical protein